MFLTELGKEGPVLTLPVKMNVEVNGRYTSERVNVKKGPLRHWGYLVLALKAHPQENDVGKFCPPGRTAFSRGL